jgi:hypothetical protein
MSSGITSEYICNEVFKVLKHKAKVITHQSRTTPYPRGVDLRNGSRREGGRTHLQKRQGKA